MMVKFKAEWKDIRAVFWFALTLGVVIGVMLASLAQR